MKKFFAITLSLLLLLSLTIPAFAVETVGDEPKVQETETYANIDIKNPNENESHKYYAYQIFQGYNTTYTDGSHGLTSVNWGVNVDKDALLTALKTKYSTTLTNAGYAVDWTDVSPVVAMGILSKLNELHIDGQDIADVIAGCLKNEGRIELERADAGKSYTASNITAGYYLIKEETSSLTGKHDAYSAYILSYGGTITVNAKSIYPTVDKLVWDETTDAEAGHTNGWGESADHEINEKFQFRLIADLPRSNDYAFYETYKVVFTDTMSEGVTFDHIDSVTVDGVTIEATGYTVDNVRAGEAGKTWTLTIADLKAIEGVDLSDGAKVIVTYTAHLNENAKLVTTQTSNNAEENTVFLQYSNNPKVSGSGNNELGQTPKDTVFVFTYTADATKYSQSVGSRNELAGAEFKLYRDIECTDEVKLAKHTTADSYYPILNPTADTEGVAMVSDRDGNFKIIGLDHGTYYIKETKAPVGYKTLEDPIKVVISAKHKEDESGDFAAVELDEINTKNSFYIVNKMGASLPTTGGIGTTIFYVVGAVLMFGAAILLVTKKRMNAEK